jgi:hypothetical protein
MMSSPEIVISDENVNRTCFTGHRVTILLYTTQAWQDISFCKKSSDRGDSILDERSILEAE